MTRSITLALVALVAARAAFAQRGKPRSETSPGPPPALLPITGSVPLPGVIMTIVAGTRVQGRLERGDQMMTDSTWADVWAFQGTVGQRVRIELRSDEFDTYLQLLDANGNRLSDDDDGLGDLDSRIEYTLPHAGAYQIIVNNYGDERRAGVYTLTLRQ